MKGYDACVFPREGEPVLVCLEASEEDAARTAWTGDVRLFRATTRSIRDRRPLRVLELAREAAERVRLRRARALARDAGVRPHGRRADDVHDATGSTAFGGRRRCDAAPAPARAVKTAQEVERMRLANDIAAAAMEHCKLIIEPGMSEAQIAAEWQGFVHGEGTGWEGKVDLALGFSLVWSGPGIRTFTATTARPVVEGEPTLFEIWVCADGYWCDHTKNLVAGELTPRYRELETGLMAVYEDAVDFVRPGASLAELDRRIRAGIEAMGFPGQPSHPICHGVGARAHEPPYAHQAGGGEIAAGMVLAIEPGCYIDGGGGLRVEDNFLVTESTAPRSSRRSRMG